MAANSKLKEFPWGAIVAIIVQLMGAVALITTINVQLSNLKDETAKEFKNMQESDDKEMIALKDNIQGQISIQNAVIQTVKEQVAVHQNTLDQRGAYGIANNEKTIKIESRLDNLEKAVGTINDNIQTIVNRIWNEKKPRGVVN